MESIDVSTTFGFIRPVTTRLLKNQNDVDFLENPAVDVVKIAKESGITEIKYVPKKEINGEHTMLRGSYIYVDMDEEECGQRFSIAHEIGHWILEGRKGLKDEKQAARKGDSWKLKESEQITKFYLAKQFNNITNKDISTPYHEILTDYFAANLLMPIERFILWEDKSNEEIAVAFNVKPRSVEKRRDEIKIELELLTPKNACSEFVSTGKAMPYDDVKALINEAFPISKNRRRLYNI